MLRIALRKLATDKSANISLTTVVLITSILLIAGAALALTAINLLNSSRSKINYYAAEARAKSCLEESLTQLKNNHSFPGPVSLSFPDATTCSATIATGTDTNVRNIAVTAQSSEFTYTTTKSVNITGLGTGYDYQLANIGDVLGSSVTPASVTWYQPNSATNNTDDKYTAYNMAYTLNNTAFGTQTNGNWDDLLGVYNSGISTMYVDYKISATGLSSLYVSGTAIAGLNASKTFSIQYSTDNGQTFTTLSTFTGTLTYNPGKNLNGTINFANSIGGVVIVRYQITGVDNTITGFRDFTFTPTATTFDFIPRLANSTAYSDIASGVAFTVKGFSGQTANLQEWRDSSSNLLAYISATGGLTVNSFGSGNFNSTGIILAGQNTLTGVASFEPFVNFSGGIGTKGLERLDRQGNLFNINKASVGQLLAQSGSATLAAKTDSTAGGTPHVVIAADFNGDGENDIAAANQSVNTVSVFLNTGSALGAKTDFTTGTTPYAVEAGDFNGDGKADIVVTNRAANTISVLINTTTAGASTPTFATKVDYTTGTSPQVVAVADLNGDSKPDIAVGNNGSNTVSIFINNGSGTFATKVDYTTGTGPSGIVTQDLNGDGYPDVAVTDFGSNLISVLMNNGSSSAGTFATKVDYTTGTQPLGITTADLNNDGKYDLAVANSGTGVNTVSVFLNAGNGTFAAKVDYASGTGPFGVSSGDINGDGYFDLISANSTANTVSVFINNKNGTFATKVDTATGTTPISLAIADINGDKRSDVISANNGTTTISVLNTALTDVFATTTTGVGVGTSSPEYPFVIGTNLLATPTGAGTGLAFGVTSNVNATGYAWIQSYGQRPLNLNPAGNRILLGSDVAYGNVSMGFSTVDYQANSGWPTTHNSNLTLTGLDYTSIAWHDASTSVGTLGYHNNMFFMDGNQSWGPVMLGINIRSPSANLVVTNTATTSFTNTAFSSVLQVYGGTLGGTAGNEALVASFGGSNGNQVALGVRMYRHTTGSGWGFASMCLTYDVDNSPWAGSGICTNSSGYWGYGGIQNPTFRIQLPNVASASGQGQANAWVTYSSQQWKENITEVTGALDYIARMRGVFFNWKPEQGGSRDIGFIAEEVAKVIPELAVYDSGGKPTGLKYDHITAVLLEGMKEQQDEINKLSLSVANLTGGLSYLDLNPDTNTLNTVYNISTARGITASEINVEGALTAFSIKAACTGVNGVDISTDLNACATFAEKYAASELTEPGDIVELDLNNSPKLHRTIQKSSKLIIGVVTDSAGVVLGNDGYVTSGGNYSNLITKESTVVGFAGNVAVKVNMENGEIKPGDSITSSSTAGEGMKASQGDSVIGIALEGYNKNNPGKITILLSKSNN